MLRPDTTKMRFRSPVLEQRSSTQHAIKTATFTNGSVQKTGGSRLPAAVFQRTERMWDMVIPRYHERSAEGEIFNNPMYKSKQTVHNPLIQSRITKGKSTILELDDLSSYAVPKRTLKEKGAELSYKNAITDAYAKVSANEGNTLLWIGEFKETLTMLRDIGNSLKNLHDITKKQRIEWLKGKLSVEGQQKLTLAILFGLLPLESAIADFMEGLFRTKDHGTRHTARGFRVYQDSDTYEKVIPPYRVLGDFILAPVQTVNESITVEIRTGVLYDIDVTDVPWVSIILDPKSVVSTAYALARLSFVIDWFINVGGTLAAWSPSIGINELSAWATVKVTHSVDGSTTVFNKDDGTVVGSGEFMDTLEETWRVPIDRGDLPVIPRLDINLDVSKILSMVLLFAKIRKK